MPLVPFLDCHLDGFKVQPAQSFIEPYLFDEDYRKKLTAFGQAYSLIKQNRVIACGGVAQISPSRANLWGLIADKSGRDFLAITRQAIKIIESLDYVRLELTVKSSFEQGHRFALLLGFKREGTMEKWGDDMQDYDLYAKVKK